MKESKIIFFLKVFGILLILGFVLPLLVKLLLINLHLLDNKVPSGNSVFVMNRGSGEGTLIEVFFNTLQKFISF